MKDPRFNTGDAELDRALEQDDAKLRAMGAYDEKPAPYAREFIYTDVAGGNWRVFRREDDSRVATCWDGHNAQLIVDALNRDAAPSVSSSAPPPTWDEMASMFPDNTKRANRNRGSSAEPAPPTDLPPASIAIGADDPRRAPVQEEATGKIDSFADQTVRATSNKTGPESPWIIWSGDHHAWWAPNRGGYTPNLFDAGLYEEAEAKRIQSQCSPRAGSFLPVGAISDEARRLSDEIKSRSRHNNVASFFEGSISERETLTAQNAELRESWYAGFFSHAKSTEEPEPIAENEIVTIGANALAVKNGRDWPVVSPVETATTLLRLIGEIRRCEERSTHHALLLHESRAAVARLTTENELLQEEREQGYAAAKVEWERFLEAEAECKRLRASREQAIQDIEALPRFRYGTGELDGPAALVEVSPVLSILRGSNS